MPRPSPIADLEILKAACCVAGLDGDVCEKELPILKQLAERAGVGQASLGAMMDRAQSDPSYYEKQLDMLVVDPDQTLKVLFLVAAGDASLEVSERVILQYFADKLGVARERFDRILAAAEKEASR